MTLAFLHYLALVKILQRQGNIKQLTAAGNAGELLLWRTML
jgi:hypothetical protein